MKEKRSVQKIVSTFFRKADPKYPDIIARTALRIGGVVTAIVRKHHA